MLTHIRNKLQTPYPYFFNNDRDNLLLILGILAFIMLFVELYQPFDVDRQVQSELQGIAHILIIGLTLIFNIIFLPKIFPAIFEVSQWTFAKYLIFLTWNILFMSLFLLSFEIIFVCKYIPPLSNILGGIGIVALTLGLPIFIASLFIRNNLLKTHLEQAHQLNQRLKTARWTDTEHNQAKKLTITTDTSENLVMNPDRFYFAEAQDNYSNITWDEDGNLKSKLLRITLKNLNGQLTSDFVVRCHRSYLVNLGAVDSVLGNANGYKLIMRNSQRQIPVSRAHGPKVMERIQNLS